MNYELAKELKDAGFPQGEPNGFVGLMNDGEGNEQGQAYFPTLSELIEACEPTKADDFILFTNSDVWEAGLNYVGYFDYPSKFKDTDGLANVELREEGSTPEEAVARLWLALNKS